MAEDQATDQSRLIRRGLALSWMYVRAHPVLFTLSCVGSVIMAAGTVASTVALGWLTDDVVLPAFDGTEATRSQSAVIAAVLLVTLARSAGVVMRRYFAGRTVYRCKDDLQIGLGKKYLGLPAEEVRAAEKGKMLAHVDSDVEVATDLLSPLPFTIGVLALLGMSVVSLALVDWVLMIVAVALLPLIAIVNQLNAVAAKGPAVDSRESVGRLSTVAAESFDGAVIVKTLGREVEELDRFSIEAGALRDHSIRLGRVRAIFASSLDLLPDIGVVVLVVLGAARVGSGDISTGQLVQAVALFSLLVFPLRVIGFFFGDMPPSVVAYDRIRGVLQRPDRRPHGASELGAGPIGVHVDAISVSHGETPAVADVTLDVAPAEVVALVGHTGCGKSTLLSAVADMVVLDAGEIRLNGT
ncbi:MAG: ABC transporter transmembrane domain-containing protein, partial [Acidimicrobiales bacterium]